MSSRCKDNFSVKHYLDTLHSFLDAGYHIGPVGDYFHNDIYYKHILLRHDVDLSLDYALDMALLEKDNGIHATYYILLESSLYNTLSPKGRESIRAIRAAGHEIGLHIDTRYYQGAIEFSILSNIAGQTVSQWSKHLYINTPPAADILLKKEYGNAEVPINNCYKYIADSGMSWRDGCCCQSKEDKIQLLIHPEWWMVSPAGKRNKWEILEDLKEEAKGTITQGFREFRELLNNRVIEVVNEPIASPAPA